MKKRILSILLCCVMLVVLLPVTVSATEGTATVTLINQSDWEDGSGYQMLLDSTATAYGTHIAPDGPLVRGGDSTEEVYAAFAYKIPMDAGWTRDTQAVVHYGSSQTIEIPAGIYDFCITNPTPGESIWIVGDRGEAYSRADDFEFKAGMHYTFTTSRFGSFDGVTLVVTDAVPPVISGLTDGKSYCGSVSFTASDNIAVQSVTVNGTELQPVDGVYTLNPADGTQTVVVSDADNQTTVSVTVNDEHTYEWQSENGMYWQHCTICGFDTNKKANPTILINGADKVCRTQDYKFSFTLPEGATDAAYGYEFIGLGDGPLTPTVEDNLYSGILKTTIYPVEETDFKLIVSAKTADGFEFSAEKTVAIQNEHSGGTATCTEQATCEICGEKYGDLKPHSYLTEWSTDEASHWHECTECRVKTDEAEHTDTNKDHKCDVCDKVLSECTDTNKDHKCDVCDKVLSECTDTNKDHKCNLCGKTLSEHSGSTATCKDKAVCEICGESYGELDSNNHADLKHIDAKAATKTAEGNIEYWYCSACGKYYKDAKATQEIKQADTVTAKLPDDSKSPQTGDNANPALWIALLLASCGTVTATAIYGRKKKRLTK